MGFLDRINEPIAKSIVGRWFHLEGSGVETERKDSKFTIEIRAGLATFVTMVCQIMLIMSNLHLL